MKDNTRPNRSANQEKAEGSRDTAEHNSRRDGGGITNRPLDEERENQQDLPERGHSRDEEQR